MRRTSSKKPAAHMASKRVSIRACKYGAVARRESANSRTSTSANADAADCCKRVMGSPVTR